MDKTPLLKIESLNFSYTNRLVLKDINLQIFKTDFLAIIGPNGGGKTTLMNCILGLEKPCSGSVSLFDTPPKKGRSYVGYLAQHNPYERHYPISVEEVVLMGLLGKSPIKSFFTTLGLDARSAVSVALKKSQAIHLLGRQFNALSGGEKQRILLARALVKNPKMLILDEPTTGIDSHSEYCFYKLLKELHKTMAIIIISHDISAVSTYVKSIACLNKTLAYHGSKELMPKDIEKAYCCHVDLLSHGVPHRVLKRHTHE